MIFEVRAPQDEAKIVPNRLSEPLSSGFGRAKSTEEACREASRATRGAQVARKASRKASRGESGGPGRAGYPEPPGGNSDIDYD